MGGLDIESLELRSENDIPERIQTFRAAMEPSRLLRASMLQDLEKNAKLKLIILMELFPKWQKVLAFQHLFMIWL